MKMLNGYNQKKSNQDKKRILMPKKRIEFNSILLMYNCQIFFLHSDNEKQKIFVSQPCFTPLYSNL